MYHRILFLFLLLSSTFVSAHTTLETDSLHEIAEVVVTGTRAATDVRHLSQTITVIDSVKLNGNYRQSVLPTLMEQVPGFMLTSRGMMGYGVSTGAAGGMMLRGISSSYGQIMVLIDGHPQYNGIYGHSIADSYQTMITDHVEVLRGPASLLYGSNAMGGVINIVTKGDNGFQRVSDGLKGLSRYCHTGINIGAGSWGTVQADAANQLRIGRFSSTVALQFGRSDNHRPNMGFLQYGGFIKLGYDISSHWRTFLDADITHFDASNPGTVDEPKLENDQWITRYALNLVFENRYDNLQTSQGTPLTTSGAVSVYDNFGRHTINDGYVENKGKAQTDLFCSKDAVAGLSIYQSVTFQWQNPTTLTAGFDYKHIYGKCWYTDRMTDTVVTIPKRLKQSCDKAENEFAGYLQIRQDIARILTLDAGLRVDHHSVAGTEFVPQFGLTLRPVSTGQLKLSVSKGFRNPSTKDMFLYGTANSDSLRAERMWNYEISWRQHLLKGRLVYGVNLFYIDADNIIQTVNNRNINTGQLKNYGVELDASWRINDHWSVNTNHSYLYMENPVVSAPTYKGYIGGSFHWHKWSANAGLMHIVGMYTSTGTSGETKENFTLLNATVSYQVLKFMRLWVKGDNLLAQRYETVLGMPMPRATFMGGISFSF